MQFDSFVQSKFEDVFYNQLNHTKKTKPVLVSCWYNFYETGASPSTLTHCSYYSGVIIHMK